MNGFERMIGIGMALIAVGLFLGAAAEVPTTQPASTEPASTQPSGVLEPVMEGTTQPADPPADMREGTMAELLGQVTYNAKHEAMFRFRAHEGAPLKTLPILPNRNLARMENAVETGGKETWFRISVVVTVFENHNYLLIHDASLLLAKPQ